jgi:riboflavin biosynthesis pyrimidine reductase
MTFAEFAARKSLEASRANLPAYVTDADNPPDAAIRIGNDWSRAVFDGNFYMSPDQSSQPVSNLVFVESLDGNTGAHDPSTLGGGLTDKHVVYEGLSRVAVDAVMAGATTVRGGDYAFSVWHPELVALRIASGRPRHPIQIVVTRHGVDFNRGIMFNTPDLRVIVIALRSWVDQISHALATRPWIQTIAMQHPGELPSAFASLRAMGVARLSCVGGRHLAAQLIDANLVSDVYITTSPHAGGEPHTPMYPHPLPPHREAVRKHGTGVEMGVVFRHFTFGDSDSSIA